MQIYVEIKDQDVKRLLDKLWFRGRNLKPVMVDIGEIVRSSVVRNFVEGGRPDKWTPNAAATILAGINKRHFTRKGLLRKGSSLRLSRGKVLIDTARLQNSITARAYADRVIIGPDQAKLGTNAKYARIHQLGGMAGRGRKVRIPARPFLLVQDEDWPEIRAATIRYIAGGAK